MRNYAELFELPGFNQRALSNMKRDLERVSELGEQRLEENPNDPYTLFYTGGAYGYLGIAKTAEGSLFGGVGTAKKGFNMHEDLIEVCPQCYDAYLGPGMMNLMTSDVPWILKPILWIFGLSGSEEKAYDYLTTAFQHGKLVRLEAGTYLAQLYQRRKDYTTSFEIYSQLTQEYPMRVGLRAESMSPLWADKRYGDIISLARNTMQMFESGQYSLSKADSAWLPSIVLSYSRACRIKGDTSSAIHVLEDFVHNDNYSAIRKWRIYYSLAGSYLLQHDTLNAIENYNAVLKSDAPEDSKKGAQDAIERLSPSI